MKVLCANSGLIFKSDYFPFFSDTATIAHPIFSIPQKKLLASVSKWASGELTDIDSYLLFLALIKSTEQVEFRVPCKFTETTPAIIAANMESLVKVVGAINCIKHPHLVLTQVAITKENNTLDNAIYWIRNWESNIEDFRTGYAEVIQRENLKADLARREAALEKLIKSPYKELHLATQIANWAEIAGQFPQYSETTQTPFGNLPIAEYWKLIIRKCINAESILAIPKSDIEEIIQHCEEHIPHGSIYAHTLMAILRNGKDKQANFFGLGDFELPSNGLNYILLQSDDSIEKANLQLLIQTAPTKEPKLTDYPSRFEWLKAHTKWKISSQMVGTEEAGNSAQTEIKVEGNL